MKSLEELIIPSQQIGTCGHETTTEYDTVLDKIEWDFEHLSFTAMGGKGYFIAIVTLIICFSILNI